ncbi:hypothetical protein RJ639_012422 [Escallonia herrerae]|uniref:Reverse transcriptase/retrotransposon-derived protein RNase H-like domain-containing protein n=1 Tax=Escallonia herrerae TaxID=1293975 RepID=A0AA88VMF1_9ASTE|nr:hypothetical protein RJ639_012422 [Escallonia herrerae]
MKFPTDNGVGEVKGDQVVARQCYMASCRNRANETLMIKDLRDETEVETGKPVKDLIDIELYPGNQEKTVRVGTGLSADLKLKLVDLLRSYSDIFAWTASDMPRIDPEMITHKLNELTRRVAALGRFMSKSVEKCLPFFKAIRKAKDFEWTEECQLSFEELKNYLSSPPLLTKPVTGEDLFLYLSISEVAVSTVLIWEEKGKKRPVYYISKVLQDVETRYPRIDKVALALVISARKLRPYFQSHTVVVLTDQPLGKVLQNPDASGRLVNWSVELGEFDIKYKPRTAIKAQALSDFVVECTIPEDLPQLILSEVSDPWLLYVDGSSKKSFSLPYLKCLSPKEADYALQEVHEGLSIGLRFTSVAHPQSNGQTENMNCSILQGLKRKLDDAKGAWVDELPKALLPVEVALPTVRVLQFLEVENEENLRGNLDLLDDARAQALDQMISTKQRVTRYYNPKATVEKLSPNWEGPYKVSKVLRPSAYSLETLSGEAIPRTWNAENLRQYYQ